MRSMPRARSNSSISKGTVNCCDSTTCCSFEPRGITGDAGNAVTGSAMVNDLPQELQPQDAYSTRTLLWAGRTCVPAEPLTASRR